MIKSKGQSNIFACVLPRSDLSKEKRDSTLAGEVVFL